MNVLLLGLDGSGLNTAVISRLTALAADAQANNNTVTTLRTATGKHFILATSYIKKPRGEGACS
ncbi:hypothetical protein OC610_06560, partial [Pseudomonas sp. SAICEU22]|nr:hypothetical protein [Pseudomonas agronomica]